jgi:hypothetical protein
MLFDNCLATAQRGKRMVSGPSRDARAQGVVGAAMYVLVAHVLAGVSAATDMPLAMLPLASYPDAVCNDGSPAGFYYRPSNTSSNVWVVHQQGGGWCWDEPSCLARPPSLTGSSAWPQTLSVDGLFAANASALATAHLVYAPYCSSDAWVGNVSAHDVPFNFSFRGRAIIAAIFQHLAVTYGLGTAPGTTVLYSGCSAGARGVLFNLGYIGAMLEAAHGGNIARYGGLLDSAFWIDMQPLLPNITSFAAQTQAVFQLLNLSLPGALDAACMAATSPGGNGWKCLMGEYAVPFLLQPYLLFAYQYDSFQLSSDEGVPVPTSPPQLSYAETFRSALRAAAAADVPGGSNTTVLLPACYFHCATESPLFASLAVNGVTLQNATLSWLFQTGAAPPFVQDDCAGLNCGAGCPPLPPPSTR